MGHLTIVGGDRERWVVTRRGREKTVCARDACVALLGDPSTSPLDAARGGLSVEVRQHSENEPP